MRATRPSRPSKTRGQNNDPGPHYIVLLHGGDNRIEPAKQAHGGQDVRQQVDPFFIINRGASASVVFTSEPGVGFILASFHAAA